MLLNVFLLSDLIKLAGTFMHLDLISCILEFILSMSSRVGSRFLSWMTDDEKGLSDFLVSRLSRVFAGLILIMLFFYVSKVTAPPFVL